MERYDHKKIEKKWQKFWEDSGTFVATEDTKKQKEYVLIEFPYPSGDGLHVGHVRSWTALDVVARTRRAKGKNVLYPIGWDAFGLPTENYALKTGKDPRIVTKENTDNFRRQIKSIGLSFDWSREINTTDPTYYKWTQWIFLQLYKKGLAYKARTTINWCPKDKIGLANEEVVDGCCERCGTPVEKREKEQWMLAITKYAQRLHDDLDTVDYIERAKIQQKNWIGPSEGSEIEFAVAGRDEKIKVFTTRADTLFGVTYMVLAPEHPLVAVFVHAATNKEEIHSYVTTTKKKTEIDRTTDTKEKTGVEIKGVKAINPVNQEEIPIFIADYVLSTYGTGAIMAVPAHDERDFAFARKYNLPIKRVVEPKFVTSEGEDAVRDGLPFIKRNAICAIVRNPKNDTYLCISWKTLCMHGLVTGGVDDDEDLVEAAKREIREETGYKNLRLVKNPGIANHTQFFHRVKKENRWARFNNIFFDLENEERDEIDEKESALHEVVWKKKEELKDFFSVSEGFFALNLIHNEDFIYTGEGVLYNSGTYNWLDSQDAKQKITEAVGGNIVTTFKLRDWVFSRQRYWGEPIPMISCPTDGWVPVPEDQLPVTLPQVEKYQPTDTGESPLANISDWVNTTCPTCGGPATRETDVMPNWAGSSWYYLRYCDPQNNTELASRPKLDYWTPVSWYNGGMEHTTLHLLYSRFWHKFLFDIGVVPTTEPYLKRTSHGLILAEDGSKMSKSKGNTVSPDELVESFGADSLRLYEMFIGPFDQPAPWNSGSVVGVRRFLERVWKLDVSNETSDTALLSKVHQCIKKVTDDIDVLKMNTAVSALMILLNEFEELETIPLDAYKLFLGLLSPFAPHIAAELSERHSVEIVSWPQYDEKYLTTREYIVAIQINGKVRGSVTLQHDTPEVEAFAAARANPEIAKWLLGTTEKKAIYVPGRIISFVV